MSNIKILFCLFSAILNVKAARILAVFPFPTFSHQIVFRPLTQELAKHGHNVIVITPHPVFHNDKSPSNLTEIDVQERSFKKCKKEQKNVPVGNMVDMTDQLNGLLHFTATTVERQFYNEKVQELVNDKNIHFDLILVEACTRAALIYSYIFNAPVIQISSFGTMLATNTLVGAPNHPLFQPLLLRQRLYKLSTWEKIRETYQQFKLEHLNNGHVEKENVIIKKLYGPDTPSVNELENNVNMVFVNVHPIWNDNSPVPPAVIYMGGLHQQRAKELPKELLDHLDSSEHGTIYISFGSTVQCTSLPPQTIKLMMKVFSELSYDVIWKWDTDLPNKSRNIKVFKWLPQSDLLRHPKLKLFITQGGLQSTDEAIAGGVPLIGIPAIADQWYNVEKYVKLGIGQKLELGEFTEEEFKNAIITVIENQSYRHNILRLRTLIHDQPQTPLERATWWIEHVLRHGDARHLRCPAANTSWAEYYELEIVLILMSCWLTVMAVFFALLRRLQRYILSINLSQNILKPKLNANCLYVPWTA